MYKIGRLTIDKIAIVDYVQDCKADIFAITETWLTQNDAVVCREITPAGYRLLHRPRADRVGGGTALLYKESFNIRQFTAGEKSSFEFFEYLIDASSFQFRLVIIYRIPYSAVHPITSRTFLLEFSDYLDSLLLSKVPLCISGDFNFHIDVSGNVDSAKFVDLLESMCLTQHVRRAFFFVFLALSLVARWGLVPIWPPKKAKDTAITRFYSNLMERSFYVRHERNRFLTEAHEDADEN